MNGGAIALGHPLGMSGARLVVSLLHELRRRDGRYGLATLCVGVGQGVAALFERLVGLGGEDARAAAAKTRSRPDGLAAPEARLVEAVARHERDDLGAGRVVQLDLRVAAEEA